MFSFISSSRFFRQGRAWIELDRSALQDNINALRSQLPKTCQLMPAIKADAYGHGAILMAKELNRMGIHSFCVASVMEGVDLRKHGIKGEILILGYTHPRQFYLLHRYRLIQTVIDYSYAVQLNQYGQNCRKKLRVHLGIDTGMHRLGERSENLEHIRRIYRMRHLKIEGIFTHLCTADTQNPKDQAFTKAQANAFYHTIAELKKQGFPCPKIHLQSSYGVINYPELTEDYARVGIALYGILSTEADTENCPLPLKPVLSLKARISTVKKLYPGEATGYGLQFVAKQNMKIATLSIGYADGLPRSLSNGVGSVLINGHKAPIIGRICMDQTTVDVSHIPHVKAGDVAVLIGCSEDEVITAGDLAKQSGTITNEILSRMGGRLERVMV